jgi:MFS family permease
MAVQGISPFVWMPLGDYFGRRFALIATLAIFVGANTGLLFSNSFLSLMLLRAAQAFGSADLPIIGETLSPLISNKFNVLIRNLGAAVIGDISTGIERGALIRIYGSSKMKKSASN